jgi:hypothetical protein
MPIMSKVQEIRIDSSKMLEMIRGYQQSIKKFEEEREERQKKEEAKNFLLAAPANTRKPAWRKFSIPAPLVTDDMDKFKKIVESPKAKAPDKAAQRPIKFKVSDGDGDEMLARELAG